MNPKSAVTFSYFEKAAACSCTCQSSPWVQQGEVLAFNLYGSVSEQAYPRSEAILLGREVVRANPDDEG